MSKVVTTTVLPDVAGGSVTLGGTGDSVVITSNDFRANVLQDAGGNAVFTSNGSGTMSGMNSVFNGAWNHIQTQVASSTTTLTFTMTSTYAIYCFKFIDLNPATNNVEFRVSEKDSGGSAFNKTTTMWRAEHDVGGSQVSDKAVNTDHDSAQVSTPTVLAYDLGSAADEGLSGELWIFDPTSATYVKNFYSTINSVGRTGGNDPAIRQVYVCGYVNTTTSITQMLFTMSSGGFDGTIKMYGISKS